MGTYTIIATCRELKLRLDQWDFKFKNNQLILIYIMISYDYIAINIFRIESIKLLIKIKIQFNKFISIRKLNSILFLFRPILIAVIAWGPPLGFPNFNRYSKGQR